MTKVKDSLRGFLQYIVSNNLTGGFTAKSIPVEYHTGMRGCVKKSFLKHDRSGKYTVTTDAWWYIRQQGLEK